MAQAYTRSEIHRLKVYEEQKTVEESCLKNGGILVPLDLSLFSESAIPYAEELASSLDMTIVLFHVFLPARESIIGIPEIGSRKEEVEVRTWHLTDYFNSLSTRLENKGVRVQYQMTGMIGQSLGQRMQFALNEAISQQLAGCGKTLVHGVSEALLG